MIINIYKHNNIFYYLLYIFYYILYISYYTIINVLFGNIISSVWKDDVYNYLSVEKSKSVHSITEPVAAPLGQRGAEVRPYN